MLNKHYFPPISDRQINILLIKDTPDIYHMAVSRCVEALSANEKEKYARFHFDKDRRLFLLSRVLLKYSLAAYLDRDPGDIALAVGTHGKPRLADKADVAFNLTHSHGVAALALGGADSVDIGIDIEWSEPHNDFLDMGFKYFSQDEYRLLKKCSPDQQQALFYRLWTLKEAYIKAIGKGLSIDLKSFAFQLSDDRISVNHLKNDVENKKVWQFLQARVYTRHMLALAIRTHAGPKDGYGVRAFEYSPGHPCKPFMLKAVASSR